MVTIVCHNPVCQKTFQVPQRFAHRSKYCSHACTKLGAYVICLNKDCGQSFYVRQSQLLLGKGKYCSRVCRDAKSLAQKFWEKTEPHPNGCILWTGAANELGYGNFRLEKSRTIVAHRYAYILTFGAIPDGLLVCHRCDNPPCVNPHHMFLGTHKDNTNDAYRKGRMRTPIHVGNQIISSVFTADDVIFIRSLQGKMTGAAVAQLMHCTAQAIYAIWRRKVWKHVA